MVENKSMFNVTMSTMRQQGRRSIKDTAPCRYNRVNPFGNSPYKTVYSMKAGKMPVSLSGKIDFNTDRDFYFWRCSL